MPSVSAAGSVRQSVNMRPSENAAASVSNAPRNTRDRAGNLYMIWDVFVRRQRVGNVGVSQCASQRSQERETTRGLI